MSTLLTLEIKQEFAKIADNSSIEECGLIIRSKSKNSNIELFKCINSAVNKEKTWKINAIDYSNACVKGEILATIHSHTNTSKKPKFSLADKINANEHEIPALLYYVPTKSFFEYKPKTSQCQFIGRIFSWGHSDCLSLVTDYFREEIGIEINNNFISRNKQTFRDNEIFFKNKEYIQIAQSQSFEVLEPDATLEEHDILFLKQTKISKIPSHLAIYLNDNKILHQPNNDYSKIEELNNNTKDLIYKIFRYKPLTIK